MQAGEALGLTRLNHKVRPLLAGRRVDLIEREIDSARQQRRERVNRDRPLKSAGEGRPIWIGSVDKHAIVFGTARVYESKELIGLTGAGKFSPSPT